MSAQKSEGFNLNLVLAMGVGLVALLLLVDLRGTAKPSQLENSCEKVIQPKAALSERQLAQFLTIPERDTKERVRAIIHEPHCRLPGLEVRSGIQADREAYPLKFNPKTQLIVLYEGDEYAGFTIGSR